MFNDFVKYVKEQSLFQNKDRILLAVSGGIDSIAMVHMFAQSEYNFAIAHCNFSLRGEDSDADQRLVKDLAFSLKATYHMRKFDTETFAKSHKLSTQMAARTLRYAWFEELIDQHNYDYVATAHHHSDSVETVLYNLSKGTGIAGLRGILTKKEKVIRPILFALKTEIEDYANTHQLRWREDTSNASDKYHRNYIRHHVVPAISKINPSFESSTKNTLNRLKDTELILIDYIEKVKEKVLELKGTDFYLDKKALRKLPGLSIFLDHILLPYGYNYQQALDIVKSIDASGKLFFSKTHQTNIDREFIIISPIESSADQTVFIEEGNSRVDYKYGTLKLNEISRPETITTDLNIGLFDLEKIEFPLELRSWRQGDKFHPLGMSQRKKISDFLIDNKVPLTLKERVMVILSNNKIIWVVGHRIDDRVKIGSSTKRCLQITNG